MVVMVLDDSTSMKDHLAGTTDERYKWVERYTGLIFKELLARSNEVRGDRAVIKPRYYIHTIIYGSHPKVWPDNATEELDIEQVIQAYASTSQNGGCQNSLGLGGLLHGTDARSAFEKAHEFLSSAITKERFKDSFPPMVFHLTDAESQTDAGPIAEKIKQLATSDGNVLVVNALIGTSTSLNYKGPEDFPGYQTEAEAGPGKDSITLFRMSSEAPETIRKNLVDDGIFPQFRPGARLFFDVRTREMLKHVLQLVGSQGSR
jgi:hypothetical protein